MFGKETKAFLLLLLFIVASLIIGFLSLQQNRGDLTTMGLISKAIPSLKIGNWWIIETHIIEDISETESGQEKLGDKVYYHMYKIVGQQNINGKQTWVIDIKASKVPLEFANDHDDNYLWQLFVNKEDFTLVRFKKATRSRRYLVTGQDVHRLTFDFSKGNPVVIQDLALTPLDIPLLPHRGQFPRFLNEEEKEFSFIDERTYQKFVQYIVAIRENVNGNPTNVLYVTLYNKDLGVRTQKWVPGLPWWQEWRCTTTGRFIDGTMWYAKLIEWGSGEAM